MYKFGSKNPKFFSLTGLFWNQIILEPGAVTQGWTERKRIVHQKLRKVWKSLIRTTLTSQHIACVSKSAMAIWFVAIIPHVPSNGSTLNASTLKQRQKVDGCALIVYYPNLPNKITSNKWFNFSHFVWFRNAMLISNWKIRYNVELICFAYYYQ